MAETLTKKQKNVYNFIVEFIDTMGYPPSIREICEGLGFSSTATVHTYINTLEKKGYISKGGSKNRSLSIINRSQAEIVPSVGIITAGQPITAIENIDEHFPVKKGYFEGEEHYILTVRGESMIDAGINDGDKIIVSTDSYWKNGDIIVALIGDEATVKRIYKEKGYIRLQPENKTMEPIIVDNVIVQGKVVGLFRRF